VTKYQDQAFKPKKEQETIVALKALENAHVYVVSKREDKPTKTQTSCALYYLDLTTGSEYPFRF
jgi:hypothetical protein